MIGRRQFAKAFAGALAAFGIAKPSWVSAGGEKAPEGGFSPETGILTLDVAKRSEAALLDAAQRLMERTGCAGHALIVHTSWLDLFDAEDVDSMGRVSVVIGGGPRTDVAFDSKAPKLRIVGIPRFVGKWPHPMNVVSHDQIKTFGGSVEVDGKERWRGEEWSIDALVDARANAMAKMAEELG